MTRATAKDIDDYIARYPRDVQALLTKIRLTIHRAAPQATEKISYAIPTFNLDGNLVHFAAFKAILASTRPRQVSPRSGRSWRDTKHQRVRFNSHSIGRYHLRW
jgi:uncharacterized protein YdhG (YjbR/CyaY superfamily)